MRTEVIGQQFIELKSVGSTNKYAAEQLAKGKLRHGAVIMAHEQTAGRGQRGRVWKSGTGLDLACSVVLLPEKMRASEQFVLAKMTALAVHDVVAETMKLAAGLGGGAVRIKWPNDILIDRKKISGILIKNEITGTRLHSCIVGIGINVNTTELDADFNATSLRMETGHIIDRMDLLEDLCVRIEHYWSAYERGADKSASDYTRSLWNRGLITELELDNKPFSARPMDVDAEGRLMVEDEKGKVRTFGTERLRFAAR